MKVAVFENMLEDIQGSFDAANLVYYNNLLDISYYVCSQDFGPIDAISNYDIVFVDLDLASRSDLDGYSLIANIYTTNPTQPLVIITGANKNVVEERFKEMEIDMPHILRKPITYIILHETIQLVLKKTN